MTDIIERAEAALAYRRHGDGAHKPFRGRVPLGVVNLGDWASEYLDDLISALKAARVENGRLRADAEMWRGTQSMYRAMDKR